MSVIIPARDEAANLPHVFGTLPQWVDEVVLVDGHSVDDTVAVSRAVCPKVKVVTQPGRGKGDALRAGFAAAAGDIIVTIDADGSADGAEIVRFVGALLAGADYAKGSRFANSGGSDDITGLRRYGNRLLSVLVNRMFGTHFTDLCYGYNAFWARHLDVIEVRSGPGFEVETLMNIRAAKAGLTIYEVPSHESPRIFGDSNLHAIRDGWRILKVIVREWLGGPRVRGPGGPAAAWAPVSVNSATARTGTMASTAAQPYRMLTYERDKSVSDREIVAAIAAGDATGVAAAFGRYAQELYTYCRSRLAEPADAAGAVQDTFVVASAQVRRLPEPDRLRAWLFALARNECQRRLRETAPSSRLYEAAQAMDDTGSLAITGQAELRALVRAALAGLDPVDREISELNLRHGFYGADLADILGVQGNRAHVLAARARSRFERSLDVLPVVGWEHCPDLTSILNGRGGTPSPGLRPRARRHIRGCDACRRRKRIGLNPAILLGLLPVVSVPTGLRRQVLDVVASEEPAAVAHRGRPATGTVRLGYERGRHRRGHRRRDHGRTGSRMADGATRFGSNGFPVQLTAPLAPGWQVASLSAAVAAAAALALLGGGMYYADHLFTHGGPATGGPAATVVGQPRQPAPTTDPSSAGVRTHSPSPRPGNGPGTAGFWRSAPYGSPRTGSTRSRASRAPSPRPSTPHTASSLSPSSLVRSP